MTPATETTISAVLSGAKSVDALNRRSATLQALKQSGPTTRKELAEKIKREAPEFAGLADVAEGLRGFDVMPWMVMVPMLIPIMLVLRVAAEHTSGFRTHIQRSVAPRSRDTFGSHPGPERSGNQTKRCPRSCETILAPVEVGRNTTCAMAREMMQAPQSSL